MACRLKKPLFIHEREASCAVLKTLSKFESDLPPVVIHCFTGTIDEAKMYTEKGFYIGLTGTYFIAVFSVFLVEVSKTSIEIAT